MRRNLLAYPFAFRIFAALLLGSTPPFMPV